MDHKHFIKRTNLYLQSLVLITLLLLSSFGLQSYAEFHPDRISPIEESWRWQLVRPMESNSPLQMAQAKDGTLWLGLTESIAQFDGLEWTDIDQADGLSLERGYTFVATNGDIYIRSLYFIHRYVNGKWQQISERPRLRARKMVMREAPDGSIWTVEDEGISHIRGDRVTFYKLNDLEFDDIYIDGKNLWLVEHYSGDLHRFALNSRGLNKDDKEIVRYPVPFKLFFKSQTFSIAGRDGCIWHVGMHHESSVWCYQPKNNQWNELDGHHIENSRTHFGVKVDKDNHLWIWGSYFIAVFDGRSWRHISAKDHPIPRSPYDVFHSKDGSIWVYGNHTPIWRIASHSHHWQQSYYQLIFQMEYPKGVNWFIDPNKGIAINDKNKDRWLYFDAKKQLIDSPITIKTSAAGQVWIGGEQHENGQKIAAAATADINELLSLGQQEAENFQWKKFILRDFGRRVNHSVIFVENDGSALIASDIPIEGGGLVEITPNGQITRHRTPKVPTRSTIVTVDKFNTVWFSSGMNLHSVKRDELGKANYKDVSDAPKALYKSNANRMKPAENGDLWISTRLHGVFRRNANGLWQHFTKEHGLSSPAVQDLIIHNDGSVFCTTHDDIFRFDGRSWTKAISSLLPIQQASVEIKSTLEKSVWINIEMRNVEDIKKVKLRPLLTSPYFRGKHYALQYVFDSDPPDTKILAYNERVQGGDYNIVQWTGVENWQTKNDFLLSFSYQVDNQAWSAFGDDVSQVFENLKPGAHTIKVRARDADFNIDPSPATIEFEVIPPLIEQRWFQISLLLVFSVTIAYLVSFFKLREFHNRRVERLRMSFFTNISHELRTPLTLILGPIELLLNSQLNGEQNQSVNIIKRNAERLSKLLDELLDFRKLEEGAFRVNKSDGDIVQYSKELLEGFKVQAQNKNIELFENFCGQGLLLEFDKDIYEKIFNNLISNAIKYTPDDGKINVAIEIEKLSDIETAAFTLTVEDSGIGIKNEELDFIFDKFFRSEQNSQSVQGSGIGLALSKELIEALEGSITVESPIDSVNNLGTRFRCTLPLKFSSATKAEDIAAQSLNSGSLEFEKIFFNDKPVVLVVDDDEDISALIRQCLEEEYHVHHATNGYEGLQQVKANLPDLIITDVMMPVMDGVDFCQQVKSNEASSHIPVIMLSARGNETAELKGLEIGADDYIKKPFKLSLLKSRVKNLIQSRKALREKFLGSGVELETKNKPRGNEDFQERAIRVIYQHLSDSNFGANEFADAMNMSYQNLYVKIKALTGEAPQNFINAVRLEKAMQMIKSSQGKINILELAASVGYEDSNYFSRRFKQKFGMAPSKVNKEEAAD